MRAHEKTSLRRVGGLAVLAFLVLHLGLSMAWWHALALTAVAGLATIRLTRRRIPRGAQDEHGHIRAEAKLKDAADRLATATRKAPLATAGEISRLATGLTSIRRAVLADPGIGDALHGFIAAALPGIVTMVETYVAFSARIGGDSDVPLHDLAGRIRMSATLVGRLEGACLRNDLSEVAALSSQAGAAYT
ncbi:hypothetical protein CLV78_11436 [Aliiruegeria haliotis]|uniref:5-bromo-4-chloroindolyl phosphate hydrolysis protein n=1 Tax=Aliiruegeria haliotis TaxID=1280846 RepID=A0A2T0RGK0_9RHOB|nr:hypothetical protein [Aliiruegeria haliotis]PRY20251.1 hypothetical protein CLV78_11436 [Aliiruegeria haliotis]